MADNQSPAPPQNSVEDVNELMATIGATPRAMGLADVTIRGMGSPNSLKEFLVFPKDPSEFFPRTILTGEEAGHVLQGITRITFGRTGSSNAEGLVWGFMASRTAIGGVARDQAVDVSIMERKRTMKRGMFGGMFGGGRGAPNGTPPEGGS